MYNMSLNKLMQEINLFQRLCHCGLFAIVAQNEMQLQQCLDCTQWRLCPCLLFHIDIGCNLAEQPFPLALPTIFVHQKNHYYQQIFYSCEVRLHTLFLHVTWETMVWLAMLFFRLYCEIHLHDVKHCIMNITVECTHDRTNIIQIIRVLDQWKGLVHFCV